MARFFAKRRCLRRSWTSSMLFRSGHGLRLPMRGSLRWPSGGLDDAGEWRALSDALSLAASLPAGCHESAQTA